MSQTIPWSTINATSYPHLYDLGAEDLSRRASQSRVPAVAQLTAWLPFFAARGPIEPILSSPDQLSDVYGSDTWLARSKYYTHASALAQGLAGQVGCMVAQRLKPSDASSASLVLWVDVLSEEIPQYQRDVTTGQFVLDGSGQRIPSGPAIPGHTLTLRVAQRASNVASGEVPSVPAGDGTPLRLPILELPALAHGVDYQRDGVRIWRPRITDRDTLDQVVMEQLRRLPVRIGYVRKPTATSVANVAYALDGSPFSELVFENDTVHPTTNVDLGIADVFSSLYTRVGDANLVDVYGPFAKPIVYGNYLTQLQQLLFSTEAAFATNLGGLMTDDAEDYGLMDWIEARSIEGKPYYTVRLSAESLNLTSSTHLHLLGGSDGTMSLAKLDELVVAELNKFGDPMHPYYSPVITPARQFFDIGYGMTVKQAAPKFLANGRRAVALSTHVVGADALSEAEETSVATSLLALLDMHPDSTWYNTPGFTSAVFKGSMVLNNSAYKQRVGQLYDFALKLGAVAGATSGQLNTEVLPDISPYHEITTGKELLPKITPASVLLTQYVDGRLCFSSPKQPNVYSWNSQQTVYPHANSVLKNIILGLVTIIDARLLADRVYRDYVPAVRYQPALLVQKVNDAFSLLARSRWGSVMRAVPNASITAADEERGYSYDFRINVGGNVPIGAATLSLGVYRTSDLPA